MAAALAMALPRTLTRSLSTVVLATTLSVALAAALAAIVPDAPLPGEVLARTSPDLRDLIVALAAGAAGAYATLRPDISASLPGVAVAVALVPPLAAIGITLEAGRGDLAGGATLLFAANLLAILLAGTAVFLLTGFVPRRRLENKGLHVVGGGVVVALATVAVAVPLAVASIAAADAGSDRERLHAAASSWLRGSGSAIHSVIAVWASACMRCISSPG